MTGRWEAHTLSKNHAKLLHHTSHIMEIEQTRGLQPPINTDVLIEQIEAGTTVSCKCSVENCNNQVDGIYPAFKDVVACDECGDKWEYDRKLVALRDFWEGGNGKKAFCPKLYRETDINHEDFIKVWPAVRQYADPRENLIFCGQSGTCKTRAMMQRLKLCWWKGLTVDVLWAHELDKAIEDRKTSQLRDMLMVPKVLGIDDFLTSGSSLERVTNFLKGIIDARLIDRKTTLITTNLTARDITSDAEKFGNATKADQQRVSAIIRRLRGEFKMVDFDAGRGDGRF